MKKIVIYEKWVVRKSEGEIREKTSNRKKF